MLAYTINQLSKLAVSELKAIAKENNLKGYSSLRKSDLIEFIDNNINTFGQPIVYIYNDNLNMYSITNLDYLNLSIKDMTNLLKEHVAGKKFSNQAMNEKEVKACYRAGFRVRHQETLSEAQTLELFNQTHSIHMTANTTQYNTVEVPEVENVQEETQAMETTVQVAPVHQEEYNTYIVGNQSFSGHVQAVQYCDSSVFDPNLMIISNEQINANTSKPQVINNKIYWYAYRLRGFSLGCQPSDFIDHNDNIGKHGIVCYNRQLTDKELSDYELELYSMDIVA